MTQYLIAKLLDVAYLGLIVFLVRLPGVRWRIASEARRYRNAVACQVVRRRSGRMPPRWR